MATRKPMKKFKRYEGGGEVMGEMDPMEAAAKKRGLEMSNKEAPVGFFERIRMGNIDQPGSEAYNRFGAGRGRDRGEAVSVNQPMPAAPAMPAASSRVPCLILCMQTTAQTLAQVKQLNPHVLRPPSL